MSRRYGPLLALWIAYSLAWARVGTDSGRRAIWKRIAYATRYGQAGLTEVMNLDQHRLGAYISAVGELVHEENEANRPKGRRS